MKKALIFLILYTILYLVFSCKKNELKINPNKISLVYNNKLIVFDKVIIQTQYLELNGGRGFSAFQVDKKDFGDGFNYYIIIDFKRDSNGKYILHNINFGINKIITPQSRQNTVYFASLSDGYNKTNFNFNSSTDNKKVTGNIFGKLISLTNEEIEITDGKFELDFETVKK